jgi:hypothetical protein
MTRGKGRTRRKRAAGKAAAKPRRRSARKSAVEPGAGHNRPPPDAPISSWQTVDETASQIGRDAAARRRSFIAATSSGMVAPVGPPPFALRNDPSVLHAAMLDRIAALEETIAKLPIRGGPLDGGEIEEIKREIAKLKTLSPVPTTAPTEAEGTVRKFGEKVLQSLAVDQAKQVLSAASKALWTRYGEQLIALAHSIGEWIASLPPPL